MKRLFLLSLFVLFLFSSITPVLGMRQPGLDLHQTNLQQYSLTVTGTNWTTTRAIGLAYQTLGGAWRLIFNIGGSTSAGTSTLTLTVAGVIFHSSSRQAVAGWSDDIASDRNFVKTDSGAATISFNSGAIADAFYASGDVELDGPPDWLE